MRAAAIDRFGGPEELTLHHLRAPALDQNEILIARREVAQTPRRGAPRPARLSLWFATRPRFLDRQLCRNAASACAAPYLLLFAIDHVDWRNVQIIQLIPWTKTNQRRPGVWKRKKKTNSSTPTGYSTLTKRGSTVQV